MEQKYIFVLLIYHFKEVSTHGQKNRYTSNKLI
ncbi:hypothetical protein SAMN05443094_10649 [Domibacillus enclensis]|uniref:Uncharacterized protein n=1 Tax=Domibacillus enclensis TaxID=1017273 RepID=A0A1N6Z0I7_9BACI|nr:hypothetical protein SAMN05443094_10649 [Domibacillus enclensis]